MPTMPSNPPASMSTPTNPGLSRRLWVPLLALAFLLYGRYLTVGYLADDFLYLRWFEEGMGELMRRVTWLSDPQMVRPLPALAWALSALPYGAALQHGLSVLLHGCVGILLARRVGGEVPDADHNIAAGLFGALFIAFPLFAEPVIWLSSATDLWAAALAMAALEAACPRSRDTRPGGRRILLAVLLFSLALLSKETVLGLPLVAVLLLPPNRSCAGPEQAGISRLRAWRPHAALVAVAIAYLVGRWWIFGGPGGYLDADGKSQALSFDAVTSSRNLIVQVPLRLILPLVRDEGMPWVVVILLAFLSFGLWIGFATRSRRLSWARRWRLGIRGTLALLAALLPVLPVLSVDADHGGGRLIYWPVVITLWVLSRLAPWAPRQRPWAMAWLLFWCLATLYNGASWGVAGRRLQATLDHLASSQQSVEQGSVVYIDGYDSWRGAYVWRNGFHAALARRGIGGGIDWRLGHGGLLEAEDRLAGDVFVWELDDDLRWVDQTLCARDLRGGAEVESAEASPPCGRWIFHRATGAPAEPLAVRLKRRRDTQGEPSRPLMGRLYWRRGSRTRFNISDSKPFRLAADRSSVDLRLRPGAGSGPLQIQIQTDDPGDIEGVGRLEIPASCHGSPEP